VRSPGSRLLRRAPPSPAPLRFPLRSAPGTCGGDHGSRCHPTEGLCPRSEGCHCEARRAEAISAPAFPGPGATITGDCFVGLRPLPLRFAFPCAPLRGPAAGTMARNDTRPRVFPRVRWDVMARPAGPKQSPRQLFPAPALRSREIASSGFALSRSASLSPALRSGDLRRGPWLAMTPDRGSFPAFGGMSLRGPKGRSNLLASCPRCGTAITGDCFVGLRPLSLRFASGTMARDVIRPRVFARVR
jgi:hypothetical protein